VRKHVSSFHDINNVLFAHWFFNHHRDNRPQLCRMMSDKRTLVLLCGNHHLIVDSSTDCESRPDLNARRFTMTARAHINCLHLPGRRSHRVLIGDESRLLHRVCAIVDAFLASYYVFSPFSMHAARHRCDVYGILDQSVLDCTICES